MEVIKYLKEHGLAKLMEEFSIKTKEYDEGLIVLNYNQIDSPKAHPIVMECRGLILDKEFNVVSRSFDRFFNFGEQPDTQSNIDIKTATCYEKVDGSLIRIYNWKNRWYIATRGTAFAESDVNGFGMSFKDLVFKALKITNESQFQHICDSLLHSEVTYIFEVTSTENRVVKRYDGYKLHFLAARDNTTYEYAERPGIDWVLEEFGAYPNKSFQFSSMEECLETSKALKDLDEGYVLYQNGTPICKIKSPAYCAVHLIKGEGLTPKRIAELVLTGEQDEYLTYFPEDKQFIDPYVKSLENLLEEIATFWTMHQDLQVMKEFALAVKDTPFSAVLFHAKRNGVTIEQAWSIQRDTYKVDLLLEMTKL